MIGIDDPELGGSPADGAQATAEMLGYAGALAERRREQPREDIVTGLLRPGDAGEVLTTAEFGFFFVLLTVAGNETTRHAASGGMLAFFEHPDQWRRLAGDPALAVSAAGEIIRWVSPVNLFRRTAIGDTELGWTQIPADSERLRAASAAWAAACRSSSYGRLSPRD